MPQSREALEAQLNDFDPKKRQEALETLMQQAEAGAIHLPPQSQAFNMHAHTFFSFNGYGYSPSYLAWKGRCEGLYAMGLVDFDVLDGVDEFLSACERAGLRACASMETRIFIPEFGDREINSPGEPGISYHMGAGFTSTQVEDDTLVRELKRISQERTKGLVERVNTHLDPVKLDYEQDILPLVPKGNATERHVCVAYYNKAKEQFGSEDELVGYWSDKLGLSDGDVRAKLDDEPAFHGLIRGKTMKRGGVGYVQPEGDQFPRLEAVNAFSLAAGAIPCMTWLDGTSAGEQAIDELLDLMQDSGVAAANIIPDRNWNISDPETKKLKVEKLHEFARKADERHLPILVGTEMNAFGQKFVDDFDVPEMAPLHEIFLKGAHILHAHTQLQKYSGFGYMSDWAATQFSSVELKNAFFEEIGKLLAPARIPALSNVSKAAAPSEILDILKQ